MAKNRHIYDLRTMLIAIGLIELVYWLGFLLLWVIKEEVFPGLVIDRPFWIYVSMCLPLLPLIFYLMTRRKNKLFARFSDHALLQHLTTPISSGKSILKFGLLRWGLGMLLLALSTPKLPKDVNQEVTYSGMDIIIALDVSKSMLAEDIQPNRLERSKLAISNLISGLEGNRIGLIAFAGNVDNVFPLTTDYAYAKSRVSKLTTDYISKQGTDIGTAIDVALSSFNFSHGGTKTIIIITDGEDHQNAAPIAAERAVEMGVTVHTIGIGSPEGVPIPEYENGQMVGYKVGPDGETVVTKLNVETLKQIAMAGQGSAMLASGSQVGLAPLVKKLNELDKEEFTETVVLSYEHQFQFFLALSLLFFTLEFLISERRSRWADQVKLFES